MTRRFTLLRVLVAAVILVDALALGAHEVALHSSACYWGPWKVPQC